MNARTQRLARVHRASNGSIMQGTKGAKENDASNAGSSARRSIKQDDVCKEWPCKKYFRYVVVLRNVSA
ncbi:hypothetical protein M408DRAFT_228451 [Serendipita vermifera MAFF 305830]|uniref:Uncharacterized protein n=1 Tax=Serendipita vermifera MAFF 305830 TaxID=933852 RepID=A0A0C3AJY7_SERVB|nr:hypothetical protein M408DRAFT_228451 [Serendipita vermifera MAFF 305830]